MEDQNYTIKDIARMAGVSAGTVDRVLHNRGDVSPKSKAKVQKVLDEIHYQPNVFAIGLAAKKKYSFLCLIPYYIEHDYWHSVVGGIERARQELRPFNVGIDYLCYHHGMRKVIGSLPCYKRKECRRSVDFSEFPGRDAGADSLSAGK